MRVCEAVKNLVDAYSWMDDAYEQLLTVFPPAILRNLNNRLQNRTVVHSFAGVHGPGAARRLLEVALEKFVGGHVPAISNRCLATVEWDPACNIELADHPERPSCRFKDIEDFWMPEIKQRIDHARKNGECITLDALEPAIKSRKAVRLTAHCLEHDGPCSHPRADQHEAGLPCKNFTPFGDRTTTSGYTASAIGAWLALRPVIQEKFILVEESDKFELKILTEFLGSAYIFRSGVYCSGKDGMGWVNRRLRFMAAGFHRVYVSEVYSSLDNVMKLFTRTCTQDWSIVAEADNDNELREELQDEIDWAINRPTALGKNMASEMILETFGHLGHGGMYAASLTYMEAKHLKSYRSRTAISERNSIGCYNLTQNAATGFGIRSTRGMMPTLISNPGLHWCDPPTAHLPDEAFVWNSEWPPLKGALTSNCWGPGCVNRWLSSAEHLICHLNPVLPWMSDPRRRFTDGPPPRTSNFQRGGRRAHHGRSRNDTIKMCGNGMNIMMVGYVQLYILLASNATNEGTMTSLKVNLVG